MGKTIIKHVFFGMLLTVAAFIFADLTTQFTKKLREVPITVRGISEREVKSDLARWIISAQFLGTDMDTTVKKAEDFKKKFFEFCKVKGLKDVLDPNFFTIEIEDNWVRQYEGTPVSREQNNFRYAVTVNGVVESKDVDKIQQANAEVFSHMPYVAFSGKIEFAYTKFNILRNEMVQESFADAQRVAEHIAKSANVKLERIQKLSQGPFTMVGTMNRSDESDYQERKSVMKIIRTVSTVTFTVK
ncbi:SIMPL domain-containing protein [Holospora curviuscula]|uniref:Oxidative stress defense protein n=1 Tax=Holospora curviuscula TaxID=1082868 RepID=A0A2S5RE80_9PROT|nr:SIMPL domain-containing protein [Holospora curviuscula]PPE05621.1 hypothetical protein HCUR_00269 [Holospora curviuscula]